VATVAFSLTLYLLLYAVLLPVFLYFFMRLVVHGPEQKLPEQVRAMRRTAWYR
jgi:cytochrome bd-type quinol oxidase subunit 1